MKKISEKERREILRRFLDEWGEDSQKKMAIEEMAELTKELCKSWRGKTNKSPENIEENRQKIREETADVLIVVTQMKLIFGEKEVEEIIDRKLYRGLKNLEREVKYGK